MSGLWTVTRLNTIPADQPTDGMGFTSVEFHKTTADLTELSGETRTVDYTYEARRLVLGETEYRVEAKSSTDMCLSMLFDDYKLEIYLSIH